MMENIDREKFNKFCQENGIKFVVLFGSRAKEMRGEKAFIREDSDFDVAVLTLPEKNIRDGRGNYANILFGLSEILNIPDYELDLTDLNNANILLRYEITSTGELLYGDRMKYEELKAFSFRDYVDARPLFDLESLLVHKRQNLIAEALK